MLKGKGSVNTGAVAGDCKRLIDNVVTGYTGALHIYGLDVWIMPPQSSYPSQGCIKERDESFLFLWQLLVWGVTQHVESYWDEMQFIGAIRGPSGRI